MSIEKSLAWVPPDMLSAVNAPALSLPDGAFVTVFCDPDRTPEVGSVAVCAGGALDYAQPEGNAVWAVLWVSVELPHQARTVSCA